MLQKECVFYTKFLLWLPTYSAEFCIIQMQLQTMMNNEGVESVEWHS